MPQWTSCNAVLNIHYIMFAHNVQVYILTQGGHVLKVTPQVAALGGGVCGLQLPFSVISNRTLHEDNKIAQ